MSINVNNVPQYQDTDLLTLYRWALANGAAGQRRTIQGRDITFPTTAEIISTITWLEQRIQDDANAASGAPGNVSVVTFNDPI
jgi:hypothetical protein